MEPRPVEQLPPPDLDVIASTDGRGRRIDDLFVCTILRNSGPSFTNRFGAESLAEAVEGAKELAALLFEEVAHEYLSIVPDARPHPDDTTVVITLTSELTGQTHQFSYQIPVESQPNADRTEPEVFYRF
jgi:hypothetical protein